MGRMRCRAVDLVLVLSLLTVPKLLSAARKRQDLMKVLISRRPLRLTSSLQRSSEPNLVRKPKCQTTMPAVLAQMFFRIL